MTTIARFGRWPADQPPPQYTGAELRLYRWLSGEPEPIDDELAALIRREFAAQERYRMQRDAEIKAVVVKLAARTSQLQAELLKPRSYDEMYASGFHGGAYLAYSDAAQEVQNVLNKTVAEANE